MATIIFHDAFMRHIDLRRTEEGTTGAHLMVSYNKQESLLQDQDSSNSEAARA